MCNGWGMPCYGVMSCQSTVTLCNVGAGHNGKKLRNAISHKPAGGPAICAHPVQGVLQNGMSTYEVILLAYTTENTWVHVAWCCHLSFFFFLRMGLQHSSLSEGHAVFSFGGEFLLYMLQKKMAKKLDNCIFPAKIHHNYQLFIYLQTIVEIISQHSKYQFHKSS